ncbi:MAG: hypothetical protein ABI617_07700 [Sphingomicrobium sp.]
MANEIGAKIGGIGAKVGAEAGVKERIQRVRIGLTGLAFVFVLVLIGAAITNWSSEPPPTNEAIANAAAAEPNEPLAEIGAAPGDTAATNAATDNKQ